MDFHQFYGFIYYLQLRTVTSYKEAWPTSVLWRSCPYVRLNVGCNMNRLHRTIFFLMWLYNWLMLVYIFYKFAPVKCEVMRIFAVFRCELRTHGVCTVFHYDAVSLYLMCWYLIVLYWCATLFYRAISPCQQPFDITAICFSHEKDPRVTRAHIFSAYHLELYGHVWWCQHSLVWDTCRGFFFFLLLVPPLRVSLCFHPSCFCCRWLTPTARSAPLWMACRAGRMAWMLS